MTDKDPCTFKSACKVCRYTLSTERPSACIKLKCSYYTPCKRCGANTSLSKAGTCLTCSGGKATNKDKTIVRTEDGFALANKSDMPSAEQSKKLSSKPKTVELDPLIESVIDEIRDGAPEDDVVEIDVGFTAPGVPPINLTDNEKAYYKKQWDSYSDYYPDPTLETTLHTIIVIELELLWITSRAANSRGEYDMELMSRRSRLTTDIRSLRNSLPEEEASDISEKEASLSYAYEQYAKERGKNSIGGADRIFTKDAVALNAALPFKTDLPHILEKLGYTGGSVESILAGATDLKNKTPMEVAEFFGFSVMKEFAMEDNFSGVVFEANAPDTPDLI